MAFVKKDHADFGQKKVQKKEKKEKKFDQKKREEDFQKNTGEVKINRFGVIFVDRDSTFFC